MMAVRKLRVIPRRKLKSTYSQRGAMYIQAGAEYVRHVSSLVKTSINSLKLSSFSITPEGVCHMKNPFLFSNLIFSKDLIFSHHLLYILQPEKVVVTD